MATERATLAHCNHDITLHQKMASPAKIQIQTYTQSRQKKQKTGPRNGAHKMTPEMGTHYYICYGRPQNWDHKIDPKSGTKDWREKRTGLQKKIQLGALNYKPHSLQPLVKPNTPRSFCFQEALAHVLAHFQCTSPHTPLVFESASPHSRSPTPIHKEGIQPFRNTSRA